MLTLVTAWIAGPKESEKIEGKGGKLGGCCGEGSLVRIIAGLVSSTIQHATDQVTRDDKYSRL